MNSDKTLLEKTLLARLNLFNWPISSKDLPVGSALVGGAVRDGLLDRLPEKFDLDLVVPVHATEYARDLAKKLGGTCVLLDAERDISRLVIDGWTIDIASLNGLDLEEDLLKRDYTINSIALTLGSYPVLVDPNNGVNDLKKKLLVAVSQENLINDPLRLLRGFRMVAEMNLTIEDRTFSYLKGNAPLLPLVALERIKGEIQLLIHSKWAEKSIPKIKEIGLLRSWEGNDLFFREQFYVSKELQNFRCEELNLALPSLRLIFLLSDQGLLDLCFSKREVKRSYLLRKWLNINYETGLDKLDEDTRLELHRELEEFLPALILQLPPMEQKAWLARWRDLSDPLFHPSYPIDGVTLQETLDLPEGPLLGQLLHHLCKEQAFGRLATRHEAIKCARYWWAQNAP